MAKADAPGIRLPTKKNAFHPIAVRNLKAVLPGPDTTPETKLTETAKSYRFEFSGTAGPGDGEESTIARTCREQIRKTRRTRRLLQPSLLHFDGGEPTRGDQQQGQVR